MTTDHKCDLMGWLMLVVIWALAASLAASVLSGCSPRIPHQSQLTCNSERNVK